MTHVASVYARALYDLAKEEGLCDAMLGQLETLKDAFLDNPDFVKLLSTPNLTKEERCRIVDDCFADMAQLYVLNFIKLLTEKGYIRHFADCCRAFHELYNDDKGIMPVNVVSAVPLTPAQSDRLAAKLAGITGKTIELSCVVDPACIGGLRLDYDGKRVDDTVRHRLDAVHSLLKNTVL